jgi:hypothetical protein
VALAQQNPQQAEQHFQQALQLAQQIAAPPLQIEATAGLLQLQLAAPSSEQAHPAAALSALLDHPACTAETRATVGLFASARSAHAGQLADLADPS